MNNEPQASATPQRLPLTATAAALIALAALYLSALPGGGLILLPVLGLALVASYFTSARLDNLSRGVWIIRVIVVVMILSTTLGQFTGNMLDVLEVIFVRTTGQLCAMEMVLQPWLRRPIGGSRGAVVILLSGLVLMAASNTFDPTFIRFLTPIYFLFIALALRDFLPRSHASREAGHSRARAVRALFLVLVVALGAGLHYGVWRYRFELNQWGTQFLSVAPRVRHRSVGLSTSPQLGAGADVKGSTTRILRIEGFSGTGHLRAMAFDTYSRRRWGPALDNRRFEPATPRQVLPPRPRKTNRPAMRIDRLEDDGGLIFAPLSSAGLAFPEKTELQWAPADGGPLRSLDPAPYPFIYEVAQNQNGDFQGPLCAPLQPPQRARCLSVPSDIDPRVRALAQSMGGSVADPRRRVQAVVEYLMTHHAYSRSIRPGEGDPISNFLLQKKDAHCEYFAAAAVILLRYLDVPARYVIGYYAHESTVGGMTIVRQRDAHAWAECWIDGIGWITVDATPGDGRPDEAGQPVPPWQKAREWIQDVALAIRKRLTNLSGAERALVLAVCALSALAVAGWRLLTRRKRPHEHGFVYFNPHDSLTALEARFEALMRRRGIPCPPHRTWQEHLEQLKSYEAGVAPGLPLAAAEDFVAGYNAIRFGTPVDRAAIAMLYERLAALERETRKKQCAVAKTPLRDTPGVS